MRPVLIVILLSLCVLLNTGILHAGLVDLYKSGEITLTPVGDFAKGTDWESLFYDKNKDLVIAPGGNIFVANVRQHTIYLFNAAGHLLKTFSQKGLGPGDTNSPHRMSILDKRYLVVAEYASTRRISIFDLEGNFIKILKTSHSTYNVTALRRGKIVYSYIEYSGNPKNARNTLTEKNRVMVVDMDTGVEKEMLTIDIPKKINTIPGRRTESTKGSVFIKSTYEGNLLIGQSHLPSIAIYSPEGKLIHQFNLKLKPIPLTNEYLKKYKAFRIKRIQARKNGRKILEYLKKAPETPRWEHLPLYRDIKVDSEGNILVFKRDACVENCPKIFHVYSPSGDFICETLLKEGIYDFEISPLNCNLFFTSEGIYGLFSLKDSEDISLRIIKVRID